MTQHPLWSDDMWLPLMQLYLKKPEGVKPLYSRPLIQLSLELHIEPQHLYAQMFRLRRPDTPSLQHLWQSYSANPRKLSRDVKRLRQMNGFGTAGAFYEDVETSESFETDYRPIEADRRLTPMMLTMILDLYFRLTPITMVAETPEVDELARLMRISPQLVVEVMHNFLVCDPCMKHSDTSSPLYKPCLEIWRRYISKEPEELAATAAQMRAYFK